jgi:hypothetical protein
MACWARFTTRTWDWTKPIASGSAAELQGGRVAVGVLAPLCEATVVADKLTELGGTSETHPVSDEAVEEAQTAAAADES